MEVQNKTPEAFKKKNAARIYTSTYSKINEITAELFPKKTS